MIGNIDATNDFRNVSISNSEKGLRELTCINPIQVCGDNNRIPLDSVNNKDDDDDGNDSIAAAAELVVEVSISIITKWLLHGCRNYCEN